jgi:hypothetical protein
MTLETFRAKVSRYRKFDVLRGAVFMGLIASTAFPAMFVIRRSDGHGFDATCVAVVLGSYTVIAALMFYILLPMRQRHLRRMQAGCPACGKLLIGQHSHKVLATGRCPACGSQVLE